MFLHCSCGYVAVTLTNTLQCITNSSIASWTLWLVYQNTRQGGHATPETFYDVLQMQNFTQWRNTTQLRDILLLLHSNDVAVSPDASVSPFLLSHSLPLVTCRYMSRREFSYIGFLAFILVPFIGARVTFSERLLVLGG